MRLAICLLFASIVCLPAQESKEPPAGQPQRIRILGGVQERHLIRKVAPLYPPLAKRAHIQGAVRLSVLIGTDGRVRKMRLISGHPLLVPAAMDAVRQFVYRPTLLRGKPVEVLSTVEVNFTLSIPMLQPGPDRGQRQL